MQVFKIPFKILSFYGMWEPEYDMTNIFKRVYKFYRNVVVFLMFLFLIGESLALLNTKNMKDFNEIFFLQIMTFTTCCKMINLIYNNKSIKKLKNILISIHCMPRNNSELDIQKSYDYINRYLLYLFHLF